MDIWCLQKNTFLVKVIAVAMAAGTVPLIMKMYRSPGELNYWRRRQKANKKWKADGLGPLGCSLLNFTGLKYMLLLLKIMKGALRLMPQTLHLSLPTAVVGVFTNNMNAQNPIPFTINLYTCQ
jgi:hypothetical protein